MNIKVVEKVIVNCLEICNAAKLSREELIVTLAQLLIRSGYSIYWGFENPVIDKPEKINKEIADKLNLSVNTVKCHIQKISSITDLKRKAC